MILLFQAHGAARLRRADRHVAVGEDRYEHLDRREAAVVDGGAGPVQNNCFQWTAILTVVQPQRES